MWTCDTLQWIILININIIAPPNDIMIFIVNVHLKKDKSGKTFFIIKRKATNIWL